MNVCVCNHGCLNAADDAGSTCGFPRAMTPSAAVGALLAESGCLFAMLNDAVSTQQKCDVKCCVSDIKCSVNGVKCGVSDVMCGVSDANCS
jgi:hypothetical protein